MSDQDQNYTGGFSFGAQSQGGQPAQPAPVPTPPTPPAPPQPPMAGMMDDVVAPIPPADPNYVFGSQMKGFSTTIVLPAHSLKVDEAHFLSLLAGSISLNKDEKKRIVDSIPKLKQEQVDELIRIFEEERTKFVELSPKHGAQLKKLEQEHLADWRDIELMQKAASQSKQDEEAAEALRKNLGLSDQ